jgi:hypothetical protein
MTEWDVFYIIISVGSLGGQTTIPGVGFSEVCVHYAFALFSGTRRELVDQLKKNLFLNNLFVSTNLRGDGWCGILFCFPG